MTFKTGRQRPARPPAREQSATFFIRFREDRSEGNVAEGVRDEQVDEDLQRHVLLRRPR